MSDRRTHHLLQDEQGDWSLARVLLLVHTAFNWFWMWAMMLGYLIPQDTALLAQLITIDASMFMVFGTWAAGPRIARYIAPWAGAAVQATSDVVGRLKGTDNRFKDDER